MMLKDAVDLYSLGSKDERVKADALIRKEASSYDLKELCSILLNPEASNYQRQAACLALGYHTQSGEYELSLLFEALEGAKGEPTTYAYRVLSGIRKLLSESVAIKPTNQHFNTVKFFEATGKNDVRISASVIYHLLNPDALYVDSILGTPRKDKQFECDIFMVMPFRDDFNPIYIDHVCTVVKDLDLKVVRGDNPFTKHDILTEIWSLIHCSSLVIADCTGKNPNVFYEMGLAHAIGKPVIPITQNEGDIPFDIQKWRYIKYEYNPRGMKKFEQDLKGAIVRLLGK